MTQDEILKMVEAMNRFGGSFAKALGECFIRADIINTERLLNAFPEIVSQYCAMANIDCEKD